MNDKQIREVVRKLITDMRISKIEDFWILQKKLGKFKIKMNKNFLKNKLCFETKIKTDDGYCLVLVGGSKVTKCFHIGFTNQESNHNIKDYTFDEFNQIIRDLKCKELEKD